MLHIQLQESLMHVSFCVVLKMN